MLVSLFFIAEMLISIYARSGKDSMVVSLTTHIIINIIVYDNSLRLSA